MAVSGDRRVLMTPVAGSQIPQDLLMVAGGVDLLIGLHDLPIRPNEVADPIRVLGAGILARPVGHSDGATGVAEQGKGEIELLGEGSIFFNSVKANA
jgi:hypothetical protein